MTTSERLLPFLDAALDGDELLAAQPELLNMLGDRSVSHSRGKSAYDQRQMMLEVIAEMLYAVALQDGDRALRNALELKALPLVPDPFEGKTFKLAARLATQQKDEDATTYFEMRYQASIDQYTLMSAVQAMGEALAGPYLAATEAADPVANSSSQNSPPIQPPWLSPLVPAEFLPLSNTRQDPQTRAYIVLVRKLMDPTTAAFAVFSATLADLTDGGAYGRQDRHGDLYADLLLEFGPEALPLLKSLALDGLSMRFIFRASREFESFSVLDHTLFGIETSVEERRLYFKLKVPAAWLAAEVPLHLIWANLESCVLISVTD